METIFHITNRDEYERAAESGSYRPRDFESDGFIHCSYSNQVQIVANNLYRGQSDLVLLEIDPESVGAEVVAENLYGGQDLFPHIYGKLPMSAVIRAHAFPAKEDGSFQLPGTVNA